MKHTLGIWEYGEDNDSWYLLQPGTDVQIGWGLTEDDARHIVACVKVCAGVSTKMLEASNAGCVGAILNETIKSTRERDELLNALHDLLDHVCKPSTSDALRESIERAKAIAKCEKPAS